MTHHHSHEAQGPGEKPEGSPTTTTHKHTDDQGMKRGEKKHQGEEMSQELKSCKLKPQSPEKLHDFLHVQVLFDLAGLYSEGHTTITARCTVLKFYHRPYPAQRLKQS